MQNDILKLLTEIAHTERTPEEEAALIAKLAKTLPTSFVSEARKTALARPGNVVVRRRERLAGNP